LYDYGDKRFLE